MSLLIHVSIFLIVLQISVCYVVEVCCYDSSMYFFIFNFHFHLLFIQFFPHLCSLFYIVNVFFIRAKRTLFSIYIFAMLILWIYIESANISAASLLSVWALKLYIDTYIQTEYFLFALLNMNVLECWHKTILFLFQMHLWLVNKFGKL